MEELRDFTNETLLPRLGVAVVDVGEEVLAQDGRVNERLDDAVHEARGTEIDEASQTCQQTNTEIKRENKKEKKNQTSRSLIQLHRHVIEKKTKSDAGTIDNRCEDGRFPVSASCVTFSNPNLLPNRG